MSHSPSPFRAGFCAIIGRANVGKSTLINRLVGSKVAIVTPKPQTTRTRILGLVHLPEAQVILVDTPGVIAGKAAMPRALRRTAGAAANDADVIVVVAALGREGPTLTPHDDAVLATARRGNSPVILALNKIDKIADKKLLLPWMAAYAKANDLAAIVPISARRGDGVEVLLEEITRHLPEGPRLFDEDVHTDQAERVLCSELIREQLLFRTQEEVPHSAAVIIESFEDYRDDAKPLVRIEGRIVVERPGQKAIVIGHMGETIKAISTAARHGIEEMLDSQVYLRLQVYVDANWTNRPEALGKYGVTISP